MCKLGDIIVVKEFKDSNGVVVPKHSFVVINDDTNFIEGYSYDLVSNMMCSFHDEEHKRHKLSIESNLGIDKNQIIGDKLNDKDGYIKADELYYFKKEKIEYKVIAHVKDEFLGILIKLILKLYDKSKIEKVITNL